MIHYDRRRPFWGTEDVPREIRIILQPPARVLSGLSAFAAGLRASFLTVDRESWGR